MNKKYCVKINAEDIYKTLKHRMNNEIAKKVFDSLTDEDIKEIVKNIYSSEIENEIYAGYLEMVKNKILKNK